MLYSTIHHHQQGECARYCMEQRTCHQSDYTFVSTFTFLFIFIGVPSGSHCLIQLLKVKIFNCHISIRLNCSINFCTWTAAFKETKSKSSWMKCLKGGGKKRRHWCPLRGDRCYRFIHIDSTACWCTERDPVFSAARHLDTIGCLFFLLLKGMQLISGHGLVSRWILLLLMSTPSGY